MDRVSDCCNAPMTVETSEPSADYPTTNFHRCQECGEPCDPAASEKVTTPLRDGGEATLEDGEMRFRDPPDEGDDPGLCEQVGRYLDGLGRWAIHTLRLLQRLGMK